MRTKFLASLALLPLAAVAALTGCSPGEAPSGDPAAAADDCTPVVANVSTVNPGQLTMAIAEYPPYISMASGSLSGVDGELLATIAEALCLEPNPQTQSFTAIVESVKAGSADLTAGNWYINEERQENFEVSDPVYIDQMVVVSRDGLATLDELQGVKIGTTQGYLWVGDFQTVLGTDNVQLYASEDATYQDIRADRIQGGIFTYGAAQQLLAANSDTTLQIEVFEPDDRIEASVNTPNSAVLITQGNTSLLEAANAVIAQMRADGSLKAALENNGLNPTAADIG